MNRDLSGEDHRSNPPGSTSGSDGGNEVVPGDSHTDRGPRVGAPEDEDWEPDFMVKVKVKSEFIDYSFPQDEGLIVEVKVKSEFGDESSFQDKDIVGKLMVDPGVVHCPLRGFDNMLKRKYDPTYIKYGFIAIERGGEALPQCVVCMKSLCNEAMKPSLLRRHLETNHADKKDRDQSYFQRLGENVKRQRLDKTGQFYQKAWRMLSDSSSTQIDVTSSWHEAKPSRDVATQAGPTGSQEVAAQTGSRAEAESQTGGPECERGCMHVEGDNLDVSSELLHAKIDEQGLLDFLRRVEVPMCRELQKAASSRAFARGLRLESSLMTQGDLQLLHTLRFPMAEQQGLAITGLGWSASGSVIAVAYGRYSRETTQTRSLNPRVDKGGWEAERSFLCTWNLHRPRMDPDSPDLTLEAPGSLTCLAYHPEKSTIVAAGACNGGVYVWETNRDGDMLAGQSCGQSDGHEEPVYQVSWVREGGSASQSWLLITAGTDGRVLLWRFTTRGLELQRGLMLLGRDLPGIKSSKIRGDLPVGITALSFLSEDPSMFIAGTEGGHVLKCSLKGGPPVLAPGPPSSVLLRAPALLAYDPLRGPVYAAHCSPFHRNIVLCAGADPDLRVYSLLQPRPLCRFPCPSYVFSAAWSPVRPLLCVAATAQGDLLFFNIRSESTLPILRIRGCTEGLALYQLSWSPHDGQLLATGGAAGRVSVWNVLGSLAESGGRAAMAELDHLAAESN